MLTSGACRWSSPTAGISRGARARAASAAKSSALSVQTSSGVCLRYFSSSRTERTWRVDSALEPPGEPAGGLLEGPVLQQPGEQQVAGLEQRDILGVDQLALRQQPGDLQVEQGGGDDQELARLIELLGDVEAAQVGDELVGDRAQRDLGDVQLVLGDEGQQQVERAAEIAAA